MRTNFPKENGNTSDSRTDPAQNSEGFFHTEFTELCAGLKLSRKANGLRHSFCSYHLVHHANENLTATMAGNSPAMIHSFDKGLATKAEAENASSRRCKSAGSPRRGWAPPLLARSFPI